MALFTAIIKVKIASNCNYKQIKLFFVVGLLPTLTVIDANIIKQILVKDFPSWVNRRKLNGYHEMNNNHQFNAEGNQWKRLRTITGKFSDS